MATPHSATPPAGTAVRDLNDAEVAELDDLLGRTPEPLEPLDVVMLDGYLCGVIVQPVLHPPQAWLPPVFDLGGQPLPDDVDPDWRERTTALVLRRHAALTRALADDGWFDPVVLELEEGDQPQGDDPLAGMNPVSWSLMPWVAGFQHASISFPGLEELPDEAIMTALARLYRHMPAEGDEAREVVAMLEREVPLATLDDAIEDLVAAVADLADLTSELRYKVDTVRRETPKVGRNEPCPCGSGRKFKHCHGA